MPIICPNPGCGVQNPFDPLKYADVLKAAEDGKHTGYCIACMHRWTYTPEQQRAIVAEVQHLMAQQETGEAPS